MAADATNPESAPERRTWGQMWGRAVRRGESSVLLTAVALVIGGTIAATGSRFDAAVGFVLALLVTGVLAAVRRAESPPGILLSAAIVWSLLTIRVTPLLVVWVAVHAATTVLLGRQVDPSSDGADSFTPRQNHGGEGVIAEADPEAARTATQVRSRSEEGTLIEGTLTVPDRPARQTHTVSFSPPLPSTPDVEADCDSGTVTVEDATPFGLRFSLRGISTACVVRYSAYAEHVERTRT